MNLHVNFWKNRLENDWPIEPDHLLPAETLREGDIVLTPEGWVAEIKRIGWHDGPSPIYGYDVLQAWVEALDWNQSHNMGWFDVHTLLFLSESEAAIQAASVGA